MTKGIFMFRLFLVMVLVALSSSAMAAVGDSLEAFKVSDLFVPGIVLMCVIAAFIAVGLFLRNYIKVPPDKAAVISGREHKLADGSIVGSRMVRGGATFKWPLLERVDYLDLTPMKIETRTAGAITKEGVQLTVKAVAVVKIGSDDESLRNASERFLSMGERERLELISETLTAHLRAICCTMTVEEINGDRQTFSQKMIGEALPDLKKMGIVIDAWPVDHIEDSEGYLTSLGKKRTAEVQRDAAIGQAEATRDSDIKTAQAKAEATKKSTDAERDGEVQKNKNLEQIQQAERDLAVKTAKMAAETAEEEAKRDQAGPKAMAEAQKGVLVAQVAAKQAETEAEIEWQKKLAQRKEEELKATLIKQAEAEREKMKIGADAQKQKAVIDAEAAQQKAEIDAKATVATAEGQQKAAIARAEGEKQAAIATGTGEGEKAKLIGAGEAAANKAKLLAQAEGEAALLKQKLLAEAEGQKARLLAEAEGQLKLAEALKAKLLAEAEGALKKAEAFRALDEAGRFLFILQAAPSVIEAIGKAGAEILSPAFASMGQGMANIDKVTIVETGSGEGKGGVARFAGTAPTMFFEVLQQARALGFDPSGLLKKIGVEVVKDAGLGLAQTGGEGPSTDAPNSPATK